VAGEIVPVVRAEDNELNPEEPKGAPTVIARIINRFGKRGLVASGLATVALLAVVAMLAVSLLPSNGRAAHASGTGGGGCFAISGPVCTFTNQSAFADFESSSSDGCVISDTFVQGFNNLMRPGNTATQTVFVSMEKFNNCTGEFLSGAFSQDFTGTVQFGSGLSTAAVVGAATMVDEMTSNTFSLSVNLTWQGFGATTSFFDNSHQRGPGFMFNTHFNGTTRGAAASGTISDGTTNFAASPTLNGNLSDNSGGTVQLIKP
jgi:hypothetical protein